MPSLLATRFTLTASGLSRNAKLYMAVLGGWRLPARDQIARTLGINYAAVKAARDELLAAGIIEVEMPKRAGKKYDGTIKHTIIDRRHDPARGGWVKIDAERQEQLDAQRGDVHPAEVLIYELHRLRVGGSHASAKHALGLADRKWRKLRAASAETTEAAGSAPSKCIRPSSKADHPVEAKPC